MLARVFGIFNTGTLIASMVGMTAGGWIADRMGPIASLMAIASINAGAAVLTASLIPWCDRLHAQQAGRRAGEGVARKAA
jgi:MFS transporter, DHA3 family, macrolide efflux protein